MKRIAARNLVFATPLIAALAACGSETAETPAPSGPEPAELELRHDTFEAIGDSFKAIRGQLESGSPDFAVIEASATDINTRAKTLEGLFPEGSGRDSGWDTEALGTIWEKPEEFAAAREKLIEESATMMTVATSGDAAAVGEQVKALGGSCKNCHDSFRLDDD